MKSNHKSNKLKAPRNNVSIPSSPDLKALRLLDELTSNTKQLANQYTGKTDINELAKLYVIAQLVGHIIKALF